MNPLRPPHIRTAAPRLKERDLLLYENENDGVPPPLYPPAAGIVWSRLDSVDGAGPIIDTDR